jgi:hypothetical protein
MGAMAGGANDGTGEIVAACASTYCASRLEITVAVTASVEKTRKGEFQIGPGSHETTAPRLDGHRPPLQQCAVCSVT